MALINVVNMVVLDNPSPFQNPFQFEITFECLQELAEDLEWKVLYVGSAEDTKFDQTLDEILVGPVPVGVNKFVLQADPPDPASIPDGDVLGVTVVLVTCSYREKEFVRVGYYVNNEYAEEYDPETGPPKPLVMDKVTRHILSDKPRVTRFPINWGDKEEDQQEDTKENEANGNLMEGMDGVEKGGMMDVSMVDAMDEAQDRMVDDSGMLAAARE